MVLLWIPVIIASSSTTGLKWVPKFSLVRLPQSIHAFIIGVDNNKSRVSPPLNPFPIKSDYSSVVIFLLVALIVGLSKPSKEPLLLILCSTVPMFLVALTSIYLGTNLYVERFMVGYASLLLIYCALVFPKSLVLIPYIILCIFLVLNYEPKNTGYRDLAKYASNKLIVMTDASEYITAKYYVRNIKLQEGDWREWVLIKDSDILDKQSAKESFYLVNRGPMENWIPKVIIGDFYFYDWKISNGT